MIEGTKSNLFWLDRQGILKTPEITHTGLAGVMRNALLYALSKRSIICQEVTESASSLDNASEIFLTNSIIGIQSVKRYKNIVFNDFSMAMQCRHVLKEVVFEST